MLLFKLHVADTTFLNAEDIFLFCFDFFWGGINALNPESFHLNLSKVFLNWIFNHFPV